MTAFRQQLETMIRENGPMDVGTFMNLAITHYYSTRDPFGTRGDFTTAPEISQMFGEMIGVFLADSWMKIGAPSPVLLAEAGPGRGTLMADILRATKHIDGFHTAIVLHLIEISPVLREKQKQALAGFDVHWHDSIETLPDGPMLFVANEFLDALPVRQLQFSKDAWRERLIGLRGDALAFGLSATPQENFEAGKDGDVFEISPSREGFVKQIADRIKTQKGVAIFIDYGHDTSAIGDTLQAISDHKFVDVLQSAGEADLTSHVDFGPLVKTSGPVAQGEFLLNLGIGLRAMRLDKEEDLARLVNDDQMGQLFRVIAICHDPSIPLAGF